jgi:uncharacterized protein (TIGR02246 family)
MIDYDVRQEDFPVTRWFDRKQGFPAAFCGCLALVLLASGCGPQTPPDTRAADEKAIRDLDAQWAKAAADKDLDATISYYSDDASLLPPNAPIATGNHAIRAVWAPMLGPDVSLSWKATKADVAHSSDLAYLLGVYQLTTKGPQGNPVTDNGKFVEVWKKQADGKWKVVADIFNSDSPVAAVPEKKSHTAKATHATHKKHH